MKDEIAFECTNTRSDGDTVFKTFRTTEWKAFDDGEGYAVVKAKEDCLYCGKRHVTETTREEVNRKI